MKKAKNIISVLLSLALIAVTASIAFTAQAVNAGTTVVYSDDYESKTAGSIGGSTVFSYSSNAAYNSNLGLQVTAAAWVAKTFPFSNTIAGDHYILSTMGKSGGANLTMGYYYGIANDSGTNPANYMVLTSEWQEFRRSFTMGTDSFATINTLGNSSGTAYFDNFKIYKAFAIGEGMENQVLVTEVNGSNSIIRSRTGAAIVAQNDSVSFKLTAGEDYTINGVSMGGTPIIPDQNGVYTVASITDNIVFNVSGLDTPAKPVSVLFIGNSYSEDTCYFLRDIFAAGNMNLTLGYLYRGGCTIDLHWQSIQNDENGTLTDADLYSYNYTGGTRVMDTTIKQGLLKQNWDYVVVQQGSIESATYSTYSNIVNLCNYIRTYCPSAQIVTNQTWAYGVDDSGYTRDYLVTTYNSDPALMFADVKSAYARASNDADIDIMIPNGQSWQNVRAVMGNSYSLCRDGNCHANDKGRYLAASSVYETITGKSIFNNTFVPSGIDDATLTMLKTAVSDASDEYSTVLSKSFTQPTKTIYIKGETLDLTGGSVNLTMGSGIVKEVNLTPLMVSGYNSLTEGSQIITVKYDDSTSYTFNAYVTNGTVTIVPGDVNCDGKVNVSDIVLLRNAIFGKITLTTEQFLAADVNGSSTLSVADIVAIRSIILAA